MALDIEIEVNPIKEIRPKVIIELEGRTIQLFDKEQMDQYAALVNAEKDKEYKSLFYECAKHLMSINSLTSDNESNQKLLYECLAWLIQLNKNPERQNVTNLIKRLS
jgi:hypothetical protein